MKDSLPHRSSEDAFWSLWADSQGYVLRAASQIIGAQHEAEDLTSDVALAAFEQREQFADADHLRRWASRRARWLALNRLRRKKPLNLLQLAPEQLGRSDPHQRAQPEALGVWVERLPPAQKEVLLLDLDGLSTAQIADRVGKPARTVRSLRRHAITAIQRHLDLR